MAQQMSDVPEASGVLEPNGVPTVADGPVAALLAKDPLVRGTEARPRIARTWRAVLGARCYTCHLRCLSRSGPIAGEPHLRESYQRHPPEYTPFRAVLVQGVVNLFALRPVPGR